jgi:hypothetical protein
MELGGFASSPKGLARLPNIHPLERYQEAVIGLSVSPFVMSIGYLGLELDRRHKEALI